VNVDFFRSAYCLMWRCLQALAFLCTAYFTGAVWYNGEASAVQLSNECIVLSDASAKVGQGSVQPISASEPTINKTLIRSLVVWIGAHTEYDVSDILSNPPSISFCQQGSRIRYEGKDMVVDERLRAAYDMKQRRIHLVMPWSASIIEDQSTLLHELIHDVQFSNRRWSCANEPEWEAYHLQEIWLLERGAKPDFNWSEIYFLSKCFNDIHP